MSSLNFKGLGFVLIMLVSSANIIGFRWLSYYILKIIYID